MSEVKTHEVSMDDDGLTLTVTQHVDDVDERDPAVEADKVIETKATPEEKEARELAEMERRMSHAAYQARVRSLRSKLGVVERNTGVTGRFELSSVPPTASGAGVQFVGKISSYNRRVDTFYGTPVVPFGLDEPKLPVRATYQRNIEISGDMPVNIAYVEAKDRTSFYVTTRIIVFDLTNVKHTTLEPREQFTGSNSVVRFNTAANKAVYIPSDKAPKQRGIFRFKHVNELECHVLAWPSSITQKEIERCCQKVPKVVPEWRLLDLALTNALGEKREAEINIYRFPEQWMRDSRVSIQVKDFLSQFATTDIPEEILEPITGRKYVEMALRVIGECKLTSEQRQALEALAEESKTIDDFGPAIEVLELVVDPSVPSWAGDSRYVIPVDAKHDKTEEVRFHHQGRSMDAVVNYSAPYVPPMSSRMTMALGGASSILCALTDAAYVDTLENNLKIFPSQFEIYTETSIASVATATRKAEHGFGGKKTGKRWRERVIANASFNGYLFGRSAPHDTKLARMLNNHILAEYLCGALRPMELMLIPSRCQRRLNLTDDVSDIFDSIDVLDGVVRFPVVDDLLREFAGSTPTGVLGLLPPAAVDVLVNNENMSLRGLEEYLRGHDELSVEVRTEKGVFTGRLTANLDVDKYDRTKPPQDCWYEMTKGQEVIHTTHPGRDEKDLKITTRTVEAPKNNKSSANKSGSKQLIVGDWTCPAVRALTKDDYWYARSRCQARKWNFQGTKDVAVVDQRWWKDLPHTKKGRNWMNYAKNREIHPIFHRTGS